MWWESDSFTNFLVVVILVQFGIEVLRVLAFFSLLSHVSHCVSSLLSVCDGICCLRGAALLSFIC